MATHDFWKTNESEAAAELALLRAENERLRNEIEEWRDGYKNKCAENEQLKARNEYQAADGTWWISNGDNP